jgi:methyl-accepting chemotaxis protein
MTAVSESISKDFERDIAEAKILAEALTRVTYTEMQRSLHPHSYIYEHLYNEMKENPRLFDIYVAMAPNSFRLPDYTYIGKKIRGEYIVDDTGRLDATIVRQEDGTLALMEPNTEAENLEGIWYTKPKETKRITLSEPYIDTDEGMGDTLMTSVNIPLLSANNEFLGIVGIDIPLAPVIESLKNIKIPSSSVLILTEGGNYLVDTRKPERAMASFLEDDVARHQDDIKAGKAFTAVVHEEGRRYLKVFNPISVQGIDEKWSFVIAVPYSAILRDIYVNIGLFVIFTLLLITMVALINKTLLTKHQSEVPKCQKI